jgi:heme exporter protein A
MKVSQLTASNLGKIYNGVPIVAAVHLAVQGGAVLGIRGPNGAGKSTLVRMLAGVLRPNEGSISMTVHGTEVAREHIPQHVGFVAPYLQLYDEFTPSELLMQNAKLAGTSITNNRIQECLDVVGLRVRPHALLRELSSGQRQRVALAVAIGRTPTALILDEPGVTLDADGRAAIARVIAMQCNRGGFVILASNDERELNLCHTYVTLPTF